MTTDQRLERIESLLECLLEVAKIQAQNAIEHEATEPACRALRDELRMIKPIEHSSPAVEGESMRERCRRLTDDVGG